MGQPRRTYTYDNLPGWGALNFAETIGAFMMAVGILALVWDVWRALRGGTRASDNPWNGWTLEWATSSPPPAYNFVALPPIGSARPLWDLQHNLEAVEARPDPTRNWRAPIVGILAFIFMDVTKHGQEIVDATLGGFKDHRTSLLHVVGLFSLLAAGFTAGTAGIATIQRSLRGRRPSNPPIAGGSTATAFTARELAAHADDTRRAALQTGMTIAAAIGLIRFAGIMFPGNGRCVSGS